ncbi:arf-GAP domain and FG repeat-containing protein 1-like isoform X2 [Amphibalanus amphitrite]|uniref:arf-GAP domain and FG repeat-containing protein 1-like isoform X2 n=1 Tax=Amphibalanus amphitrite TaxID=1232801 RepID=UPI001C9004E3|nr:arf-GAP domain and FG repeat-containing protein 1-like isoform X2 [Amphibalanus amphitrite]
MSSRRKQEEKNLQLLREQAALAPNKQCLDCGQRGPTYVNMTIGSFVCTSCSGRLRGLTPPHRVKSISMASFSAEEIEFIKQRGNEWCKAVWLGSFDSSRHPTIDMKDDSQIKDFMELKYEKKRYYVEPSVAFKDKPSGGGGGGSSQPSPPAAVEPPPAIKPLSKLAGAHVKPIVLGQNSTSSGTITTTSRPAERKNIDLLADLSPAASAAQGDPFSPTGRAAASAATAQTANFANFANFDALNAAAPQPGARPATSTAPGSFANFGSPAAALSAVPLATSSAAPAAAPTSSSAADRYAALKELDEVLKSEVEPKIDWTAGAARGHEPASGGGWAAFGSPHQPAPASNGASPYGQSPQQHSFPAGQFTHHAANGFSPDMGGLSGYGGVPTSSAGFLSTAGGWPVPGQPASGWGAPPHNPFMSNGGLAGSPANPHNPFL